MMQNLKLPSPAKINLFLHILGRRQDGYHNIQTLFQFVDWCDYLHFHVRADSAIEFYCDDPLLNGDNNLVLKAAYLLREESGLEKGIEIRLNKNLPVGGGVGGGSSNAATTLLALNQLWETRFSLDDLIKLGEKIGADVPIFIYGHASWAEGIGNELTPMILPELWFVVITPKINICTKALYEDPRLTRDSAPLTIADYQMDQGHNDFEKVLRLDHPEIAHGIDWLAKHGRARLSGAGSVVFAGFDSKEEAGRIAAQAPAGYETTVVRGLNESPLRKLLAD